MPARPSSVDHPRVRAWLEIRAPLERQLAPLGQAAMDVLDLMVGERVLDLGCGIGGTPAALAGRVGATGEVVGLDLLADAIEVARRDPGLTPNVRFVTGDAQTYPFAAGSFDAVFSRFGAMFFADPAAGFRNLHRALRPGGRLGFVCWRGLDENELDSFPLAAAAPHMPPARLRETAEAPWFAFADPDAIREILAAAGFTHIAVTAHDAPVGSGSLAAMVEVCVRVGALGAILRDHPELTRAAMQALEHALAPRDGPAGPRLRAATWIVRARA